jgi:serine kinase of HPr protein (carbohydrate metabolism regulator)
MTGFNCLFLYQSQVNIENIKKYASELQAFLALKQIQGISMKNENYIQSLVEDDNLKQTKLSFKADDQILNLLNIFPDTFDIIGDDC